MIKGDLKEEIQFKQSLTQAETMHLCLQIRINRSIERVLHVHHYFPVKMYLQMNNTQIYNFRYFA